MSTETTDLDELQGLQGARLDALSFTPETGLLALVFWTPRGIERRVFGLGPRVAGLGRCVHPPRFTAPKTFPLVAVLRSRAVGQPLRSVSRDDDEGLWLGFGAPPTITRLRLLAVAPGEARVLDETGSTVCAWSSPPLGPRVFQPEVGDLDAAGAELLRISDGVAGELRRGALLRGLTQHLRKLGRRYEAVQGDIARLDDVAKLQRTGRMLLAQGSRIPRGATRATLDDWEEGGTLQVALDPSLPAKPQAEGLFRKARRMQQAEGVMRERREATERSLAEARALDVEVRDADELDPDALAKWAERARALGVPDAAMTPARGRTKQPPRVPFIEYLASQQRRVLVGRGSADNDALTMRIARPQDLWLHARGVPGAHVVVPLAKGEQCPPELLVDAATLAAHHSDARGETLVEVTWAERRFVRKPRKSPKGSVVLDREKVLPLRVEPERLRRLLAARRES